MSTKKIVITHNIKDQDFSKINELIPEWELIVGKEKSIWEGHLQDAEIIVGWKNDIIDQCIGHNSSPLRWIQSWSAGVNSFPLKEMAQQNIALTTASGVHAYPISETIFALMLGLTRKIHTYVRNQQTKTWDHANLGLEMHEKTVGIIGVGAIGKETAKIAKAFGMKVIGVRHSGNPESYIDEMHKPEDLNSILPQCDYVVVTTPLTDETYHMFGEEQFQLMKESAFFINIGRGEIAVEQDLIKALEAMEIAGAGLDVFEKEPLSDNSPLWNFENVIITPHTSGSTAHYDERVIHNIFIPNLKNYLQTGKPNLNTVDYKKGY